MTVTARTFTQVLKCHDNAKRLRRCRQFQEAKKWEKMARDLDKKHDVSALKKRLTSVGFIASFNYVVSPSNDGNISELSSLLTGKKADPSTAFVIDRP